MLQEHLTIAAYDHTAADQARARLDALAKPPGSLLVFAGNHGVAAAIAHHGSLRALAWACGVADAFSWSWAYGQGRPIEALTGAPI